MSTYILVSCLVSWDPESSKRAQLITDLAGSYLCSSFDLRMLFVNALMFSPITALCINVLAAAIASGIS